MARPTRKDRVPRGQSREDAIHATSDRRAGLASDCHLSVAVVFVMTVVAPAECRHGGRFLAGEDRKRRGQRNGDDPGVHDGVGVARPQARRPEASRHPAGRALERGRAGPSDRRSSRSRRSGRRAPAPPRGHRASRPPRWRRSRPRRQGTGKIAIRVGQQHDRRREVRRLHRPLRADRHRRSRRPGSGEAARFQDALKATGYGAQVLFSRDISHGEGGRRGADRPGHQGPDPRAAGQRGCGSGSRRGAGCRRQGHRQRPPDPRHRRGRLPRVV